MINFTLEVIMYIPAIILMLISSILIWRKYKVKKEKFYLCLMISWFSLTLYFLTGAISFIFLSLFQYQLHFVFLIPVSLGLIISVDLMERYTVDPKKLVILSITMTGFFITLFNQTNLDIIDLPTGGYSIKMNDPLRFWFQLAMAIPIFLYFYYCLQIYLRMPKTQKKKALINLVGGFIFGPISFFMNFVQLGWSIPGIVIIFVAIGAIISSYSFYQTPELLEVLINSSNTARYKLLTKILPICAKCKNIRDSHGEWHPIDEYLSKYSDLKFSHGICEECAKILYPDLEIL
ncbi:MAG: hypothetical protein ACTSPA_02590 [Promethearchaeota archaeon]